MENKKSIFHFVNREKFTSGYVNFMKICMNGWDHVFAMNGEGFPLDLIDDTGVYFYNDVSELRGNQEIYDHMKAADKIIVSGVFNRGIIKQIPAQMLRKTYFQFWGGDFYRYREKSNDIKESLKRMYAFRAFRKCGGLLFLIKGEYEEFRKITNVANKNFVVPVPPDPTKTFDLDLIAKSVQKDEKAPVRIIVGNSATPENCHREVLDMLNRFADCELEIVCPLSYGSGEYAAEISEYGRKLFGERFVPITQYMDKEKYIEFLASCDIGIFNNDRQQALGNIRFLLGLGKKVYIRETTSMWNIVKDEGYTLYPITELRKDSWDGITYMPGALSAENAENFKHIQHSDYRKEAWTALFKY